MFATACLELPVLHACNPAAVLGHWRPSVAGKVRLRAHRCRKPPRRAPSALARASPHGYPSVHAADVNVAAGAIVGPPAHDRVALVRHGDRRVLALQPHSVGIAVAADARGGVSLRRAGERRAPACTPRRAGRWGAQRDSLDDKRRLGVGRARHRLPALAVGRRYCARVLGIAGAGQGLRRRPQRSSQSACSWRQRQPPGGQRAGGGRLTWRSARARTNSSNVMPPGPRRPRQARVCAGDPGRSPRHSPLLIRLQLGGA